MSSSPKATQFSVQASPVNITADERTMYREVVEDAMLADTLGYDGVWMIEHHFSDYYPCPSPLLMLAHVAAHAPRLSLGTAVLVLPWYLPMRMSEELHMLSLMTQGELHIGLGRGTAALEYEAFGMDQDIGREQLEEGLKLLQRSYGPQPFDFKGDYYNVNRKVTMKPFPASKPTFYGAIGSPEKAAQAADMGVPPLCLANFPDRYLENIIKNWKVRAEELKMDTNVSVPLQIKCFIGDTAEEAREEGRRWLPETFRQQVKHYETDTTDFSQKKGYESFARMFANLAKNQYPENLDPYLDMQLTGTPEMIKERLERLQGFGFNHFVIQTCTIGQPKEVRHRNMTRFAQEVMPHFQHKVFTPKPALQVADVA
ncbi:MAG: class flavin-dependent oxidoreductase [Caulobacter sp.]|nr:class flavin-dependent oxidoreductase [Caulobacter sp.]